jgi:hypothetical protein
MFIQVLCRGCESKFPAPSELNENPTVICPICGADTYDILRSEVDRLLQKAGHDAVRRAAQLPPLPRDCSMILTAFWQEVRESYISAQYSGAMILGCSFLEYLLNEVLSGPETFMLDKAIKKCEEKSLIDASMAGRLIEIKSFIRNRYAHGNFKGISGDAEVKITHATLSNGKLEFGPTEISSVSQMPVAQVFQKRKLDSLYAKPALENIRAVAEHLISSNSNLRL